MVESDWECSESTMLDDYDEIHFEDMEIEELGGTVVEVLRDYNKQQQDRERQNIPVSKKRSRTRNIEN